MKWLPNVSLVLLATIFALLLGEGILRWRAPIQPSQEEERFWLYDSELGWTNRPDFQSRFRSTEHGYHGLVSFDALGLRKNGTPHPAHPELKILMLGDSTTLGMEVDDDKAYPALVESFFRRDGRSVAVYNAGVRGYGTDQSYLRLRRLLPLLHPDVVVYMSCGNDFQDNITIKNWYRTFSKPAFVLPRGKGGTEVPLEMSFRRHAKLDTVNLPAQRLSSEEYRFVKWDRGEYALESGYIKATGVGSWLRRHSVVYDWLEALYYVHLSHTSFNVETRNHPYEHELLRRLMIEMSKISPRFYVTSFTKELGGDGGGYDDVKALAETSGLNFLDIRPYFHSGVRYDWRTDSHWNETGHRQAAEAIYFELGRELGAEKHRLTHQSRHL